MEPVKQVILFESDVVEAQLFERAVKEFASDYLRLHVCKATEEAIECLRRTSLPCLFVLNLVTRGEFSLDVISRIKKDPDFSNTPVVIISEKEDLPVASEALKAGANAILVRDIDTHTYLQRLKSFFSFWLTSKLPCDY